MVFEDLHKWQNNTHKSRQCSTRQLTERGNQQHAYMSPAQRHTLHIDHLAILVTSQMQQTQAQGIPLLNRPAQQQTYTHADSRLEETQSAVYGRIGLRRHLRYEHNDYKRNGCNTALVIYIENHT